MGGYLSNMERFSNGAGKDGKFAKMGIQTMYTFIHNVSMGIR